MKNIKARGLTCHLIYCLLIHKPYSMSHRDEDFDRYWKSAKGMAKKCLFCNKNLLSSPSIYDISQM